MWYDNVEYTLASESSDGLTEVLGYAASNGGTATLNWDLTANAVSNATFAPAAAASVTYANNNQCDVLAMTPVGGNNALQSILVGYDCSHSRAFPIDANYGEDFVNTFVYGTKTFNRLHHWWDEQGGENYFYQDTSGGTAWAHMVLDPVNGYSIASLTLNIATTDGTTTSYSNPQGSFDYIASGPNLLTSIGGLTTQTINNVSHIPIPAADFIYDGQDINQVITYAGNGFSVYMYSFDGSASATMPIDGSGQLGAVNFNSSSGSSNTYSNGAYYGRPGTFYYGGGTNLLTAVNGQQYIRDGDFIVPAPNQVPGSTIRSFEYNGAYYYLTPGANGSWNGGYAVYSFQGSDGNVGTLKWDPYTKTVGTLEVGSPWGGAPIAVYRDGTASGHSGSLMLDGNASFGPNALTWVNNVAYTTSGSYSTPPPNTSDVGNAFVQGNQWSLGLWLGDTTKAGMTLTYLDGWENYDTGVITSSSRPNTDWAWEHPSSDYMDTLISMELGPTHQLKLYPLPSTSQSPETEPSVVLDPNPNGASQFKGAVRFDGAVRIAPHGDLSMGEFTNEPSNP